MRSQEEINQKNSVNKSKIEYLENHIKVIKDQFGGFPTQAEYESILNIITILNHENEIISFGLTLSDSDIENRLKSTEINISEYFESIKNKLTSNSYHIKKEDYADLYDDINFLSHFAKCYKWLLGKIETLEYGK